MNDLVLLVSVIGLLGLAAYLTFRPRASGRLRVPSPILPASELQRQYGLYAENRPVIRLDPERIPLHLRDLIPLAETWGIADDIIRFDFGQKTDDRAKREFVAALANRIDEVQSWISDRPEGAELSDEAATFMYMLYAWDEVRDRDDGV